MKMMANFAGTWNHYNRRIDSLNMVRVLV
uniref:Uncharacterized protein n=1 Tax=Rhizophora mucronata TaxID=61149 RepID=A0A2P2PVI2_RHIMU